MFPEHLIFDHTVDSRKLELSGDQKIVRVFGKWA